MKFLEFANGKYHLSKDELNGVHKTNVIGFYSYENPIYPLYDLSIGKNSDRINILKFKTTVLVKDTYINFLKEYTISQALSDDVLKMILNKFHFEAEDFKATVDIKAIIKSLK